MKLLVSGSNSGLGKYLQRYFQCDGIARGEPLPLKTKYDAVIHCAVSTIKDVTHKNLEAYVADNILLTKQLLSSLSYEKFIYISSVDVYPRREDNSLWKESDEIVLSTSPPLLGIYAITKLMSETAVMGFPNWMILRCSSLLNVDSRQNSTIKMLDITNHYNIFVNGSSIVCFVLVSDIAKFIEMSVRDNLTGIYNMAGSEYISLDDMAEFVGSDVTFGDYVYLLGRASNAKACRIAPFFDKTFQETIEQFNKEKQQ